MIQDRCPTFSWSESSEASGYELALYRVESGTASDAEAPGGEETELVTRVRLPAGTTGWTPSLARCLDWGERYAWSVRAIDDTEPGTWSEASLFRVTGTPSAGEVDAAIETLRRFLEMTSEEPGSERSDAPPGSSAATTREALESVRGPRGPARLASKGSLTGVPLENETVSAAASAPSLGDPSLTVDANIALGPNSNLFKEGYTFLWDDASRNLALGEEALAVAAGNASGNTAIGYSALTNTTGGSEFFEGSNNTAVGERTLVDNTYGHLNTAVGRFALSDNLTGRSNTAVGIEALNYNSTGSSNIAIGAKAGDKLGKGVTSPYTTMSDNIFVGNGGEPDEEGTIRIGDANDHTRAFIAGISGTSVSGDAVQVDSSGQLGVSSSSRRFKEGIEPLEDVTDRLLELEPVTFRYRPEVVAGGGGLEVGLVAEEVAEVFPELVTRDDEDEPFGVHYELLSVLLLQELQGQHELLHQQKDLLVDQQKVLDLQRRQGAALRQRVEALEQDRSSAEEKRFWWRRIFSGKHGPD